MTVPVGTMLGWSTAPGDAGTWGLLDPDDTRAIVHAASLHPRTRWCVTVVIILSFRVSWGCDLRRPVVDSVLDGTAAA